MIRLHYRWFAWWYLCIALGFLLLALARALQGERPWLIVLRIVIALGFGALAFMEFRTRRRGP